VSPAATFRHSFRSPSSKTSPAGTTDRETPGLDGYYDGSQAPGTFGVGATLIDESGDAWVLGSYWDDVGSFSDFLDGLTACVDTSCSPSGPGDLQP
jgi:hypothetical protein